MVLDTRLTAVTLATLKKDDSSRKLVGPKGQIFGLTVEALQRRCTVYKLAIGSGDKNKEDDIYKCFSQEEAEPCYYGHFRGRT